jgi:hypothetical protein
MNSKNSSPAKGANGKTKTVGRGQAEGRFNGAASESKGAGSRSDGRGRDGSAADRKMMRAWETISENRGAAKGE